MGDVDAVRSVASMLTELEDVWRGRIARIDELIALDSTKEDEQCLSPMFRTISKTAP